MTIISGRDRYDAEIRTRRAKGESITSITKTLGLTRWIVDNACKRLNLVQKRQLAERPMRYNKSELVIRTCPACQCKHASEKNTFTFQPCKRAQGMDNTAGCGSGYC